MNLQDRRTRANCLYGYLKHAYPEARCALLHSNAHELLFATMLSAQCTDARVNKVTPVLFAKYSTIKDYAAAIPQEMSEIIYSCGFYNSKTKNIIAAAQKIARDFAGQVPNTMAELITIPGVARKTANVVLHHWFHKSAGLTVDTHVLRLAKWFELSEHTDPIKVEQDLMQLLPQAEWGEFSLRLVLLGREVLTAKSPKYAGTVWEKYLTGM